jgi:hypothetical protein
MTTYRNEMRPANWRAASVLLGRALELGRVLFGEVDVRYLDQLRRYSFVRVRVVARKADAMEEWVRARRGLEALERAGAVA